MVIKGASGNEGGAGRGLAIAARATVIIGDKMVAVDARELGSRSLLLVAEGPLS